MAVPPGEAARQGCDAPKLRSQGGPAYERCVDALGGSMNVLQGLGVGRFEVDLYSEGAGWRRRTLELRAGEDRLLELELEIAGEGNGRIIRKTECESIFAACFRVMARICAWGKNISQ